MASRIVFALKNRNVVYLEREWHYGEHTPLYYYHYLPSLRSAKYRFVYKTDTFIMYEKVV